MGDRMAWQNEVYSTHGVGPVSQPELPMQMPPMQPMATPAMQLAAMQAMQQMPASAAQACTASCATNPSAGPIMVPVPVPMPLQMPFSMPKFAPQSVAVPPGFKLVKIPEKTPEKKPEPNHSAISDPANTERKIFVGGLNPITTGQELREYFSNFGPVMDAKVIREGEKSKGFGFVQFKDSIPKEVLEQAHIIDQRRCGVGPAFHREGAQ